MLVQHSTQAFERKRRASRPPVGSIRRIRECERDARGVIRGKFAVEISHQLFAFHGMRSAVITTPFLFHCDREPAILSTPFVRGTVWSARC